jgi:curved DNA-binding protein CbpA
MLRRCTQRIARARGAAASGSGATAASGPFDPYKILGIPHSATAEEAKKAYHKLALRFHPDGGGEGSKERFQAVQEAHEAIKNGWTPAAAQADSGAENTSGPWSAKYSTYVYEEPGSTDDNYVSSNPSLERYLQLFMLACFAFVMIRFIIHFANRGHSGPSPPGGQGEGPDITGIMHTTTPGNNTGMGSYPGPNAQRVSIHAEDDAEWQRTRDRGAANNSTGGVYRFRQDDSSGRN